MNSINQRARANRRKHIAAFVFIALSPIIIALASAVVSGCAITPQVVTTRVTKTDKGFTVESPKDVEATFFQFGGAVYGHYKSTGNETAIKAGAAESAQRSAAVGKLAEAAATLAR